MSGKRLESWKEIASYLGRQVRTVQGWEKDEGLPVHRLQHKKLGSVFAYSHELDTWLAEHASAPPEPPPSEPLPPPAPPRWPGHSLRIGVAAGALLVLAVVVAAIAGWPWSNPPPAPVFPLPLTRRYFAAATSLRGSMRWLSVLPQISQIALAPDGRDLIATAASGQTVLFDLRSRAILKRWNLQAPIGKLLFSPDGRSAYTLAGGNQLVTLDLRHGGAHVLHVEGATAGLALSADGRFLYIALPYSGVDRVATATGTQTYWSIPACPENLAVSRNPHQLFISFQCGGPGGTSGHDAIAVVDTANGAILSQIAGPPRVGSPLAISPDGNEIWTNSDAACEEPQFDHRGCPYVPATLLQIFHAPALALAHTVATPAAAARPEFGPSTFLPGGERFLDGSYLLSTTRYARLEVLPPNLAVTGAAVAPDGSHLYLLMRNPAGLADFTPTPAACSPPTPQLADWWPGDGSADDAWGMVNAHPSAAAAFAPGPVGQAFDFEHPGAYLTLGPDDALDYPLRDLTLAAWVKFSTAGLAPILARAGSWHWGRDSGGHLQFCPSGPARPGCLTGASTLRGGVWYHVALTAGPGGALSLFVNGKREAAAPRSSSTPAPHAAIYVGADPARHRFLLGELDELMLYRRALSLPELQQLVRMPACIAAAPSH